MRTLSGLLIALLLSCLETVAADLLLLEAEAFDEYGGWVLDQQFMGQMGSPFLLAHGVSNPVPDASTTARFPSAGRYGVWVRTRDWVAPWKMAGTPGRFELTVDGKPLTTIFGTEGAEWHWQDGGTVEVGRETRVGLHDLTGFEGRCDAILFCKDFTFQPPNESTQLAKFRWTALGLATEPGDGGHYDLIVAGGGIAGTCAAVLAARSGLSVALVQDRPVLGGNGSSEVRVWPEGNIHQAPYPRVGDIVAELVPEKTAQSGNAKTADVYADERKLALVRSEPGIKLLLEQRVNAVETKEGVIKAIIAQHTRTGKRLRMTAGWFADCTGDGEVGFLAGADHEITRERHMGASNLWRVEDTGKPEPFPRCPWAVDLADKPFPGRTNLKGQWGGEGLGSLGGWFWESGFDREPITDLEFMRDLNLRAMYGAWDTLKNVDKVYPNHRLVWAAYIAGKRESRRLMGDVVLTADDFRTKREFPDGCFPCSWGIDLHSPDPAFQKGHEGQEFIARATSGPQFSYHGPYWAPYRCLYSRNITNLFMAGRDISVTHEALGPVRVMRTCGMMGEVVGMAASICKKHDCSPRAVYERYLEELKETMRHPPQAPKPD